MANRQLESNSTLSNMAPQTTAVNSSQELLAQATQKLSLAITEAGTAPNDFAKNLQELLEVSTKINQFDEMASAASAETITDEAQKWREISLMTMQHARTHLVEQQQRLIHQLRGASDKGASLWQDAVQSPEVKPALTAVKPAVQPPPGLVTPPGLSCSTRPSKQIASDTPKLSALPNGLRPPPGLASAGTASPGHARAGTAPVAPPPGYTFQKSKKQAAGYPKKPHASDTKPSFFEARFGKETTTAPAVMNLDAYESD